MKSPNELVDHFRAIGKKVTPQRERIFQILHDNQSHPTAEAVFVELVIEMPSVSLKTVYQTLSELVELGEINSLDLGVGATRFDPNVAGPHHHLVCRACKGVQDVEFAYPELPDPVIQRSKFCVEAIELTIRGLCHDCQSTLVDLSTQDQQSNVYPIK